ncbi:cytochrome P450 family protein [Myxococcus stipitatus DSM 14675]|uniref:Cytochrome P450 family protein n=1 Tax=Myxococcus stipitatus (strain DSM 14675 / JCM 12634 / Mx s8) TaxID=1278073 RepID=L7UBQ1_MYXSD|nr:cytochrome P450 [Myxococcus stipitatus]AGC43894.1 cytochrome P450 family protein [Myxococcus stipitatus DSM 14675]
MPNLLSRGLFNLFFGSRRKPLASLPGPPPGILGNLGDFLGAPPWDVCAHYARTHGPVAVAWLGPSPALVLNDPAVIHEVMETRRLEFEKGNIGTQIRHSVTDDTPFIADQGADWARKHAMDPLAQPWTPAWQAAQVEPMRAALEESVEALLREPSLDLALALRKLTFDVFCVATVGEKLPTSVYDDFILLAAAADARIQAKLPLRFVSPPKGFAAAKERFYGLFADKIRAARQAPSAHRVDLMSWTLREMPDFDDRVHAHLLGGFFFGGVFSSSTTLTGAVHQLQKYPAVEERLAKESAALMRVPLDFERLKGGSWGEAVAFEALRILPAVRVFLRRSPLAPTQLVGVTLPPGMTLMISNQHLHRDPSHWVQPEVFDPERWLNGGAARNPLGSGHFFPFGRGPRACVAGDFAMVYLRTALATLFARVRIQVDSTEPFEEGFFFGVVLPKGVTGKFVARQRATDSTPMGAPPSSAVESA